MAHFGRDHWSLFAYIEILSVNAEEIDWQKLRCDQSRHPEYAVNTFLGTNRDNAGYPTRLKDEVKLDDHDDWDCADDLVAASLLLDVGFTLSPAYVLTDLGWQVANQLRRHKAQGHNFASFIPELPGPKAQTAH